jgi:hypothetical protein
LLLERHVDQRVEADDGIERGRRKADLGGVGVKESCRRDELASALDLHDAEVDTGDHVATGRQIACQWRAAPAAKV